MLGRHLNEATPVTGPEGVTRRTLAHNGQVMLCRFDLRQGAVIPLHRHPPHQIGYVVSGRVRFRSQRHPEGFEVRDGGTYVFDSSEEHGAEALEDSVMIQVFSPSRPEYV